MSENNNKIAHFTINHIWRLVCAFSKIALVLFCAFVLIASMVYHFEFPPYLLKILGIYIVGINIFAIIRKYLVKIKADERIIYVCDIKNDAFAKVLYFFGFLILAGLFCIVDILLGIGIFIYLLRHLESYFYHKVELSQNFLILRHSFYGKMSYRWKDIKVLCSLDETISRYLYIHLSESYYLDLWYKNTVIKVVINKNEQTLKLYEYIKDLANNENNLQ